MPTRVKKTSPPAAPRAPKLKIAETIADAAHLDKPAYQRTRRQRIAAGKALRAACPRDSHAGFAPDAARPDPIELLIESSRGRLEDLVPIRYGRMLASPFAFYRGAAAIMAADLARTPRTGIGVQACGDAHLANFGGFATPERRVLFDINDFDETFPAPWEWDLKRLAASFVVASRHNRHDTAQARAAAMQAVQGYADKLRELSQATVLEAWYASLDFAELVEGAVDEEVRRRHRKLLAKAQRRDAGEEYARLAYAAEGRPRIRDVPPLIYHPAEMLAADFEAKARESLRSWRESLPRERRLLIDRYELADSAIKVVGVGSVGTWCAIALLFAADNDPLFLQIKEARPSVLEPYVDFPGFATHGERVVFGQRLMQASSDLFLGHYINPQGHHVYVRQLRDVKVKPLIETFTPLNMRNYARMCGWALARSHARTADAALICGYIGKSETFAEAMAQFALDYAEQNLRDHAALVAAVRAGRIDASNEGE
ncbi:MAG TPA: DUF2252 domain-containing protein [Rubrivivax sp.]|nr:DUF2252 domain-containing protein [Rubrivivax sp.]